MTDEEAAEIRANLAALWEAIRQLNQNDQNLLGKVIGLSNRLDVVTDVEEIRVPRRSH